MPSILSSFVPLLLLASSALANTRTLYPAAGSNYPYWVREPKAGTPKPWSTIMAQHGSGSCSDYPATGFWDASAMVAATYDSGSRTPAAVMAGEDHLLIAPIHPPCDGAIRSWDPTIVLSILDEVKSNYPVDEDRVHCHGYSMGGKSCWMLAITSPSTWTSLVIAAGFNAYSSQYPQFTSDQLSKVVDAGITIHTWYGTNDIKQPLSTAQPLFAILSSLGDTEATLQAVDGADHSGMSSIPWLLEETWVWIGQQTKSSSSSSSSSSATSATSQATSSTDTPRATIKADLATKPASATTASIKKKKAKAHHRSSVSGHKTISTASTIAAPGATVIAAAAQESPKSCRNLSARKRQLEKRALLSKAQARAVVEERSVLLRRRVAAVGLAGR